jgi:predicted metal-binding protein
MLNAPLRNDDYLFELIGALGVSEFSSISTGALRFNSDYRKYCVENLCGNYNKSWTCPPNGGSAASIANEILSYSNAYVFTVSGPLRFSVDWKSMMRVADKLNQICFSIVDNIIPILGNGAVFGYGPCKYCKECAFKTQDPCRFPQKRVRSLECACVDVGDMAKVCGMVMGNDPNKMSFFGLFVYNL